MEAMREKSWEIELEAAIANMYNEQERLEEALRRLREACTPREKQ